MFDLVKGECRFRNMCFKFKYFARIAIWFACFSVVVDLSRFVFALGRLI